jgi:hypothetical protein
MSKHAVVYRAQSDIYWRRLEDEEPEDGEKVMIWNDRCGRELATWVKDREEFRAYNLKGFGRAIRMWCPILGSPGEE